MEKQADRLISGADVDAMFDVEKTTRYRYIRREIIPKPIKLGATAAKWSYLECLAALERLKAAPRGRVAQ
jgi:predicted DNA-binding transcriptional regulator AlpA